MKKDTPVLTAQHREQFGKRYARRLRAAGQLPAIIYGENAPPTAISLDAKAVLATLQHGAHVLNVKIGEGGTETCLVKDLQFGYLGDNVVHIDLARVDLDQVVEVKVHLNYTGQPESTRKPGAVLVHDLGELEVSCRVRDIPEEIRVDLNNMGEDFFAREVKLPEGVTLVTPPETMLCRVEIVKEEVVESPEAAVAAPADAEPEVLTARKEEEGEEKS